MGFSGSGYPPDNTTLDLTSSGLMEIKTGGVTASKLASGATPGVIHVLQTPSSAIGNSLTVVDTINLSSAVTQNTKFRITGTLPVTTTGTFTITYRLSDGVNNTDLTIAGFAGSSSGTIGFTTEIIPVSTTLVSCVMSSSFAGSAAAAVMHTQATIAASGVYTSINTIKILIKATTGTITLQSDIVEVSF